MSKVLITGGAGFIGSHTFVELVNAGHEPIIIDNFDNSEKFILDRLEELTGKKIIWYEQDYQNTQKLKEIIENEEIESIIHFAAYKQVAESVKNPLKYYDNNVAGFVSLMQTLHDINRPIRVVFSSSCTVYGDPKKLPVTEETVVKPVVPYGKSKMMCELVLEDIINSGEQLSGISLRYFNPIGAHPSGRIGELPKGPPANLVPFVTQTAAGLREKLTIYGDDYPTPDGSCIRDYIHVVDLAKAHVKALDYLHTQPIKTYDFVNIGIGKGASVLEIVKSFEQENNIKLNYEIGPRRLGDIGDIYAVVEKANELLGWKAEKTVADALKDAWKWQQTLPTSQP
ncbi:MAG: UDP-glucose 4-epimerase GalE [Candidatus Saccharibacteria bacterium]|nr:UDP-glucose 4-epimerase GalE [Candidatus Saccharibacteria bacterium]